MSAPSNISLVVEEPEWRKSGLDFARLRGCARLALLSVLPARNARGSRLAGEGRHSEHCKLTLLLTNDARLRELNARFRGKDTPTNVLSFPAAAALGGYLGDVALAFGVTEREAAKAGISLGAHTLHLAAHGILHLLGYDHVRTRDAKVMERMEIAILAELGVANPYAPIKATE